MRKHVLSALLGSVFGLGLGGLLDGVAMGHGLGAVLVLIGLGGEMGLFVLVVRGRRASRPRGAGDDG